MQPFELVLLDDDDDVLDEVLVLTLPDVEELVDVELDTLPDEELDTLPDELVEVVLVTPPVVLVTPPVVLVTPPVVLVTPPVLDEVEVEPPDELVVVELSISIMIS